MAEAILKKRNRVQPSELMFLLALILLLARRIESFSTQCPGSTLEHCKTCRNRGFSECQEM